MNTEIKVETINLENGKALLEVRTGQALPVREPNIIKISGDINSVRNFIEKRTVISSVLAISPSDESDKETTEQKGDTGIMLDNSGNQLIDAARAVVTVDKHSGTILLEIDPENYYGTSILGTLVESDELDIFDVNKQREFSREQLIKLFRFNRAYFPYKDKHEALFVAFQKFSVQTYANIEKESDNRGNIHNIFKQTVNANVPLSFTLKMPIYKGQPEETFDVDILIESTGSNVKFYFESVQLAERLIIRKDEIIHEQLKVCQDFPIIYK